MVTKTTKKRGLKYFVAKIVKLGYTYETWNGFGYAEEDNLLNRPLADRIAFVPVGNKILVTDTYVPEYYDATDDYDGTGRKMTKAQLIDDEQYVLVTKAALIRGLRNGGVFESAKSNYGDKPLVFVREKKYVAFRAPCGAYGTMTVGEADKLIAAIEAL